MPKTCETGFSNLFPPFLGNVRIDNFSISPTSVSAGQDVTAKGKATIQKFTPLNPWNPLAHKEVQIRVGEREKYAVGHTDENGKFEITFSAPMPIERTEYDVWAELPKPEGGVPTHHLECGPLELTVSAKPAPPTPPPKPPKGLLEKLKEFARDHPVITAAGIGGLLAIAARE